MADGDILMIGDVTAQVVRNFDSRCRRGAGHPVVDQAESGGYIEPPKSEHALSEAANALLDRPASAVEYPKAKGQMLQEVFHIDEGPVTLSAPATLSPESYQDMADRIEIFLRGLKRRSDAEAVRRHADRDDVPD
jgi:hypothetical protein